MEAAYESAHNRISADPHDAVGRGSWYNVTAWRLQLGTRYRRDRIDRGRKLLLTGRIDDAISEFTAMAKSSNERFELFLYRGIAHNFLSQYELVATDFQAASDRAPAQNIVGYWKERNRSHQRHDEMMPLFSLPEKDNEFVTDEHKRTIVKRLSKVLDTVHKYRSDLVIPDLQCQELRSVDFGVIRWTFDYVSPDRYSVYQFTPLEDFPNGRRDGWISVGAESFVTVFDGSTKTGKPGFYGEIESFLSIDKYDRILSATRPQDVKVSRSLPEGYYVLELKVPPNTNLGEWGLYELRRRLVRSLYHTIAEVSEHGNQVALPRAPCRQRPGISPLYCRESGSLDSARRFRRTFEDLGRCR